MKPIDSGKAQKAAEAPAQAAPAVSCEEAQIDFSNVKIEPIFTEMVDFETFAKSDFRAVKILACEAVKKSKKLLKFTLDDGERKDRVILSGIHEYYEPEELVGKTDNVRIHFLSSFRFFIVSKSRPLSGGFLKSEFPYASFARE